MLKLQVINEKTLLIAIDKIKEYAIKEVAFAIELRSIRKKRTDPQLKYYWLLVATIRNYLNEAGNNLTDEQVSDYLKGEFHYSIINLPNGETSKTLRSIANKSETDRQEMADFITKITIRAIEWGIEIPFCDSDYNY